VKIPFKDTLGALDASDLGSTVTIRDGGSTHAGVLKQIQHSILGSPKSMVVLANEDWRHIKTYDSDTTVEVTR
jgi:hypothetical protein